MVTAQFNEVRYDMIQLLPVLRGRVRFHLSVTLLLGVFSLLSETSAQTLAFPGALGYGEYATGGRGGTVVSRYHAAGG